MKPSILGTLAAFAFVASAAQAQLVNGAFATNLSGWTASGDAAFRDGAAFLTTATLGGGDDLAGDYNVSGTAPLASFPDLETALGLGSGALDPDSGNFVFAYEGSALVQSFAVQAGDVLSFDWTFLTNEASGADYAFLVIDGVLVDFSAAFSLSAGGAYAYDFTTGAQSYTSAPFSSAATVTVGFGVVDVNDFSGSSALILDNVSVSAIPEPSAFAAFAGLAGLAIAASRRRRA